MEEASGLGRRLGPQDTKGTKMGYRVDQLIFTQRRGGAEKNLGVQNIGCSFQNYESDVILSVREESLEPGQSQL